MRSRTIVFSSALLITMSCGSDPDSHISDFSIANGLKTEAYPSVGKIYSATSRNSTTVSSCTSTWVSPRVLITAAHCLEENNKKIQAIWVLDENQKRVYADAAKVFLHPRYFQPSSIEGGFDIAVVGFDQDVSETFVSLPKTQAPQGAAVKLVGYGRTSTLLNDAGHKHIGHNFIHQLDGQRDSDGVSHAKDTIILKQGAVDANRAKTIGHQPGELSSNLQGDSGGPLFYNGRLIGVASTVNDLKPGYLRGAYISTYFHRSWLAQKGLGICGLTLDCPSTPTSDQELLAQKASGSTAPSAEPVDQQVPNNTPATVKEPIPPQPQVLVKARVLDCNSDFNLIRQGGSGICKNSSSGFCYQFRNGQIGYDSGRVTCP